MARHRNGPTDLDALSREIGLGTGGHPEGLPRTDAVSHSGLDGAPPAGPTAPRASYRPTPTVGQRAEAERVAENREAGVARRAERTRINLDRQSREAAQRGTGRADDGSSKKSTRDELAAEALAAWQGSFGDKIRAVSGSDSVAARSFNELRTQLAAQQTATAGRKVKTPKPRGCLKFGCGIPFVVMLFIIGAIGSAVDDATDSSRSPSSSRSSAPVDRSTNGLTGAEVRSNLSAAHFGGELRKLQTVVEPGANIASVSVDSSGRVSLLIAGQPKATYISSDRLEDPLTFKSSSANKGPFIDLAAIETQAPSRLLRGASAHDLEPTRFSSMRLARSYINDGLLWSAIWRRKDKKVDSVYGSADGTRTGSNYTVIAGDKSGGDPWGE